MIYLAIFLAIIVVILAAFAYFLAHSKTEPKAQKEPSAPSAPELLASLQDAQSLEELERACTHAIVHYAALMAEREDFDLAFLGILCTQKFTSAAIILKVQRAFKERDKSRAELLERALQAGLKQR